jgi:hypothetical protein
MGWRARLYHAQGLGSRKPTANVMVSSDPLDIDVSRRHDATTADTDQM